MSEKKVSEAIAYRRSVRIFDDKQKVITGTVKKCLEQAHLAASSSNLQLWEFHHIISETKCKLVAKTCFNQPAAKTAQQLVVVVVRRDLWQQRVAANIEYIKKGFLKKNIVDSDTQKRALNYYQEIIPQLYKGGNPLRGFLNKLVMIIKGISKTTYREVSRSDLRVVGHKSAALAAQNFMISMAGHVYDTCPMEGFDSKQVKKLLKLPSGAEISMIVGCGVRKPEGIYGERFRVPFEEVYKKS